MKLFLNLKNLFVKLKTRILKIGLSLVTAIGFFVGSFTVPVSASSADVGMRLVGDFVNSLSAVGYTLEDISVFVNYYLEHGYFYIPYEYKRTYHVYFMNENDFHYDTPTEFSVYWYDFDAFDSALTSGMSNYWSYLFTGTYSFFNWFVYQWTYDSICLKPTFSLSVSSNSSVQSATNAYVVGFAVSNASSLSVSSSSATLESSTSAASGSASWRICKAVFYSSNGSTPTVTFNFTMSNTLEHSGLCFYPIFADRYFLIPDDVRAILYLNSYYYWCQQNGVSMSVNTSSDNLTYGIWDSINTANGNIVDLRYSVEDGFSSLTSALSSQTSSLTSALSSQTSSLTSALSSNSNNIISALNQANNDISSSVDNFASSFEDSLHADTSSANNSSLDSSVNSWSEMENSYLSDFTDSSVLSDSSSSVSQSLQLLSSSAIWFKNRFDDILSFHVIFEYLIVVSLLVGVCLLVLGRMRNK